MALAKRTYEEDLQLAREYVQGDNRAAETIQSHYGQRLLGLLINRGANSTEAADLLADFWGECAVGKAGHEPLLSKYHGKCGLYTWLAAVATHRLVDLKRRQRFQGNLPNTLDAPEFANDFDQLPAESIDYTQSELTRLMRDALKQALRECPRDAFLLLQLVYIHGIMQREVAKVFGWHESKISRMLDAAMEEISSRTLQYLRRSDPELEVTWDDFMQLCRCTDDLFTLESEDKPVHQVD